MLDESKIRLMTTLARYENGEGKEDLQIVRYPISGYIGVGLFKNFLVITVGYFLIWGVIIAYNLEYLLDNLHKVNLSVVALEFLAGYLAFLVLYSVITYIRRNRRYEKAEEGIQNYYDGLMELSRRYYGETEENEGKKTAGGNHS